MKDTVYCIKIRENEQSKEAHVVLNIAVLYFETRFYLYSIRREWVELLLPSDVDIRYLHWPRIEVRYTVCRSSSFSCIPTFRTATYSCIRTKNNGGAYWSHIPVNRAGVCLFALQLIINLSLINLLCRKHGEITTWKRGQEWINKLCWIHI